MKTKKIIFWLIIVLTLLPMIFFPFAGDQVLYFLGGKTIAEGGKMYIDFIDLKPPLIYMIMSPVYLLLGFHEISLRLFDFFWQLATVISLVFLINKRTANRFIAYASGIIYSLLYSTLNFPQTLQCEGLLALPLIWIIYLQIKNIKSTKDYILIGLLAGFLIALKYTFGIVLIAIFIDFLLIRKPQKARNMIVLLSASLLSILLGSIILFDTEILVAYIRILEYIFAYTSTQPLSFELFKQAAFSIGNFFGDNYSLALLALTFIGLFKIILIKNDNNNNPENHLYNFNLLIVLLLFLTVIIERKFIPYHFSRMYIPLALISAVGLKYIFEQIKLNWTNNTGFIKSIIIIIAFTSIIFTPIPRWFELIPGAIYYISDTQKYNNFYTKIGNNDLLRNQLIGVGNYINIRSEPDDKLTVMSVGTSAINYFSGLSNLSKFGQAQFYFGIGANAQWQAEIIDEVNNSDWLVVQTNDIHPIILGHVKSSWESLRADSLLYSLVTRKFQLVDSIGYFYIFKQEN